MEQLKAQKVLQKAKRQELGAAEIQKKSVLCCVVLCCVLNDVECLAVC